MVSNIPETTVKTILFSGRKSDFLYWKGKFTARSHKKKYGGILSGKAKIPKSTDYEDALKMNCSSPEFSSIKHSLEGHEKALVSLDDSSKTAHQDRAVSITAKTDLHEVGKMCKIDGSLYPSFTGSTVVGDTAASSHIGWSDENMFDVEEVREMVDGIGGKSVGITKKGKRWVTVRTQDGTETNILQDPYKC